MKFTRRTLLALLIFSLPQLVAITPSNAAYSQPAKWSLLAAGLRSSVFAATTGSGTTLENGTYFYFTNSASMGFAPSSSISLSSADVADSGCYTDGSYRMSWHLISSNTGGYRVGCDVGLNSSTTAMKAVYQSNTLPSYYPSGIQKNVSASTLTSGGWTLCYSADYATQIPVNGSTVTTPCTQTYIMLAGFSSVATPLTAPGAPTIGTATAVTPTSATVSFTAPVSSGTSTITTYTATSTPGSITGTLNQAGSGTISVSGLSPNTSYTFRVTATSSDGTSTASAASNSITTSKATPTLTMSTASSTVSYGVAINISANSSEAGKITFKANGKMIPRCIKLTITSSLNCLWKPALHGTIRITADFLPNSANSFPTTSALTVFTAARNTKR